MTTIAGAVEAAMVEAGKTYTWFGHNDVWAGAVEAATGKRLHPMDEWQAVRNALNRSPRFRRDGYIRAASWSGREILHPRFVLVTSNVEVTGAARLYRAA